MNLNLGNTSITALSHLACPIAWTYSLGLAVRGRNRTKKCANLMMWIGCCKAATKTTWFNLKPKPAPVEQRGFKVQVSQVLPWHTLERSQTFVDANDSWCSCSRRLRYWANFRRSLKRVTYRRKRTKNRRRWRRGRIGRPSKIRRQQVGWGTAAHRHGDGWLAGSVRGKFRKERQWTILCFVSCLCMYVYKEEVWPLFCSRASRVFDDGCTCRAETQSGVQLGTVAGLVGCLYLVLYTKEWQGSAQDDRFRMSRRWDNPR